MVIFTSTWNTNNNQSFWPIPSPYSSPQRDVARMWRVTELFKTIHVCVVAWYGNSNAEECKKLRRVVDLVQPITGTALPFIKSIYMTCCNKEVASIIKVPHHQGHAFIGHAAQKLEVPHLQIQEQLLSYNHQVLEPACVTLILL